MNRYIIMFRICVEFERSRYVSAREIRMVIMCKIKVVSKNVVNFLHCAVLSGSVLVQVCSSLLHRICIKSCGEVKSWGEFRVDKLQE